MPLIPVLRRQRKAGLYGHMASQDYTVTLISNKTKQNKTKHKQQRPQTKSENMPVQYILYAYFSYCLISSAHADLDYFLGRK